MVEEGGFESVIERLGTSLLHKGCWGASLLQEISELANTCITDEYIQTAKCLDRLPDKVLACLGL